MGKNVLSYLILSDRSSNILEFLLFMMKQSRQCSLPKRGSSSFLFQGFNNLWEQSLGAWAHLFCRVFHWNLSWQTWSTKWFYFYHIRRFSTKYTVLLEDTGRGAALLWSAPIAVRTLTGCQIHGCCCGRAWGVLQKHLCSTNATHFTVLCRGQHQVLQRN